MPQCDVTAGFMAGIEEFQPIKVEDPNRRWKTTLGDVMGITEWDKISDNKGSWLALRKANIVEPTKTETLMRVQYCMQLAVHEINILGGKLLKRAPLIFTTPQAFEASLDKLVEELEYFSGVALLKKDREAQVALKQTKIIITNLRYMFAAVGRGEPEKVGRALAYIFGILKRPKDMSLKTARKILSL